LTVESNVEAKLAANAAGRYAKRVSDLAGRLRALADEVEREGRVSESTVYDPRTEHSVAAHRIVHAIMWGLANANLDGLILAAAEVDARTQAAQRD
jgi:hypothetical protein